MVRVERVLVSLLVLVLVTHVACKRDGVPREEEDAVMKTHKHHEHADAKHHAHDESKEGHEGHGKHGHHNHRFEDPEKYAERWDNPERHAWQKPEEIVAAMQIEPGASVADLGTGTGYMLPWLARAVGEEGRVLALDVEESMVSYVTARVEKEALAGVEVKLVQPSDPGLTAGSLQAIMTLNTWHHISDREAYAKKIAAGLEPGGRFVIVDFLKDAEIEGPPMEMRLTAEEVVAELEAGGFSSVEIVEETLEKHYIVRGIR